MTRYIDADAVKDCIEKEVYTHDYTEHVYQIIDEFPTADVVEVVRCKDCKLYISERNECTLHSLMFVYPEFYCRSGERRE